MFESTNLSKCSECPVVGAIIYADCIHYQRRYELSRPREGTHLIHITHLPPHTTLESFKITAEGRITIIDHYAAEKESLSIMHDAEGESAAHKAIFKQYSSASEQLAMALDKQKFLEGFQSPLLSDIECTLQEHDLERFVNEENMKQYLQYIQAITTNKIERQAHLIDLQTEKEEMFAQVQGLEERQTQDNAKQEDEATNTAMTIEVYVPDKTKKLVLEFSYPDVGVSWRPVYDIRLSSDRQTVTLEYYGEIKMKQPQAWQNVQLSLCTTEAALLHGVPELSIETLSFNRTRTRQRSEVNKNSGSAIMFDIPELVTFTDKLRVHRAQIASFSFDASLMHTTVPKMREKAYLTAQMVNTSYVHPLLSGNAQIFFNGNYSGLCQVPEPKMDETFSINLGVDHSVWIKYKPAKVFSEIVTVANGREHKNTTFSHTILLKNEHTFPVNLTISDQLPLSDQERIRVTLIEPPRKDVQLESDNSVLWTVFIPAQSARETTFKYLVSSPVGWALDRDFTW